MPDALPLQDIHLPPAPGWWPPAPGWWLLALSVLLVLGLAVRCIYRYWRRAQLRRARARLFDQYLAPAQGSSAQLAALSELLRRAAREHGGPSAASLAGDEWLSYLDGADPARPFSSGPGRVLLDGPFRPTTLSPFDDGVLLGIARARYLQLLERSDA